MAKGVTKVLYIVGIGRSGSTLLSQALSQHPQFAAVGELRELWTDNFSWKQLCSCGAPFSECNFWTDVLGRAGILDTDRPHTSTISEYAEKLRWYVERARYQPMLISGCCTARYGVAVTKYAELLGRLYSAAEAVSGADVVVDASKRVSTALVLRHVPGIDVRFIHLVRDSRGVAFSWRKLVPRPDMGQAGGFMKQRPHSRIARRWLVSNAVIDLMVRRCEPVLRVRYEDFVRDPRATLEAVLAFAWGTTPEMPFLGEGLLRLEHPSHLCFGNPKRMLQGDVAIRLDDAWKQEMSTRHKFLMTFLTWPLLLKYGYLGSRD